MWVLLALVHMAIELLGGRSPLAMFAGIPGGRYIAITVAVVLALGTAIGVASRPDAPRAVRWRDRAGR